jgi:hypothetical protein
MNALSEGVSNQSNLAILANQTTVTAQKITDDYHLFMRYKTSGIFNIEIDGMRIMKPVACHFNIVFDDVDEILLGPQNINTLCPGRYYTIEGQDYFVPGSDEIVRAIKNIGENLYSICSLRFFLKL